MKIEITRTAKSKSIFVYIMVVMISLVAVALKMYFESHGIFTRGPLVFLALTISAYIGGLWPGVLAATICSVANLYYFIPPNDSFALAGVSQWAEFIVFTIGAIFVGTLTGTLQDVCTTVTLSNERALSYANQKAAFAANVSHEIRTPLNAIIGLSEALGRTKGLSAQNRDLAEKIRVSGESLLGIINDILDISKADFNFLQMKVQKFKFREQISTCVQMFEQMAKAKGLKLDLHVDDQIPPFLMGDATRIFQVCNNLIANAIKFTASGQVTVSATYVRQLECGQSLVQIGVRDTGIGISTSSKVRAQIFEPFNRGEVNNESQFEGAGLGLAISRRLVEKMGGTLHFDSTPQQGSYFWFEIPLTSVEVDNSILSFNSSSQWLNLLRGQVHDVLVVDDNYVNHLVATAMLEQYGFRVDVALSGREALQKVRDKVYSVVLMDCQMPEMDGYVTTKNIRAEEERLDRTPVPIVAVTAYDSVVNQGLCRAAGMMDCLTKPLNSDQLILALSHVVPGLLAPEQIDLVERSEVARPELGRERQVLDLVRLKKISEQMDHGSLVISKMIKQFLQTAPLAVSDLCSAAATNNMDAAAEKAHFLFSGGSAIGASVLSATCKIIENAALARDFEKVRAGAGQLEQELAQLKLEALQFLSDGDPDLNVGC